MSIFATEGERAEHRVRLASLGFDGPRPMGADPFSAEYAVCVGGGSVVEDGCGCLIVLGDPTPNPAPGEGRPAEVERGILLHAKWHQHLKGGES